MSKKLKPIQYIFFLGIIYSILPFISFAQSTTEEPSEDELGINYIDIHRRTPLIKAAMNQNWSKVKQLVEMGANINVMDNEGNTVLILAAEKGNWKLAQFLIHHHADINLHSHVFNAHSALEYAIIQRNTEMVQYLIEQGTDVVAPLYKGGKTPYKVADSLDDNEDMAEYIAIQAEEDIDETRKKEGYTPLHNAARECNIEKVKILLADGASVIQTDHQGNTPLHALTYGCRDVSELSYSLDKQYNEKNILEIINLFLQNGADINAANKNGKTSLHTALEYDMNKAVVNQLLYKGAHIHAIDRFNKTPLYSALYKQPAFVKELIKRGAKINIHTPIQQITPLHYAARYDRLEEAKFLLKKGALLHAKDKRGKTPKEVAIENEKWVTAIYLTFNKYTKTHPDVNTFIDDHYLPLAEAVKANDIETVNFLIKKGADVNKTDKTYEKTTPLMHAVRTGNLDMVKKLVSHKANVHAIDKTKKSVFMHAVSAYANKNIAVVKYLSAKGVKEYTEALLFMLDNKTNINTTELLPITQFLVEKGADVNIKNIVGESILERIQKYHDSEYKEVIEYLISKGAK